MRNPLLDDLVIDFDDEPGVVSTARDSDQTNSLDCFTHAMVNVRGCEIPRNVLQADTIVVSCGLPNFEQSSWSTHCHHGFWGTHGEPRTKEDCDKFVHSFEDNYLGICKDHSMRMIDCRQFDDPDNDRSMRKLISWNPKITKSFLEAGSYHAAHDRLYEGMYRFFSDTLYLVLLAH